MIQEVSADRLAIHKACDAILANAESKALNYAYGYATQLRRLIRSEAPDNALHVQCLYVLNNITHWRGDEAKRCRAALKAFVKAK